MTVTNFDELGLVKPLLDALKKAGYTTPTPIQAGAIPPAMVGHDLLLSAQTGSGKTAAFVLPILNRLASNPSPKSIAVEALILTPTRELALQVQDNIRLYGSHLKHLFSVPLVGGAAYGGQIRALKKGVHIVVATPGRLIDHLQAGRLDLSNLKTLVLDEADRMLDMGFSDDINEILSKTPTQRQTIMSSATWDGAVGKIAESFTKNPVRVAIKVESAHIEESVYFCDDFRHKNALLHEVLNNPSIAQAMIFTATKMSSEKLANDLNERGYKACYLHGDLPQGKRNRIVSDIKAGKAQFLVATDVAARGIDIATISHVINYDLPRQAEDYVHRIGRCGRAGRTGEAVSLCSRDDVKLLGYINRYLNRQMRVGVLEGLEPKLSFDEKENRSKNTRRFGGKTRPNKERFGTSNTEHKTRFASKNDFDSKSRFGDRRFDKGGTPKSESTHAFGKDRFDGDKKGFKDSKASFGDRRPSSRSGDRYANDRRTNEKTSDRRTKSKSKVAQETVYRAKRPF